MEIAVTFLIYTVILLAVAMAGAYTPFIRELSDRQTHLLVALSAGIFLGILFFLLLPEAIEECAEGGYGAEITCISAMFGFLVILGVDVLIKHMHAEECHDECNEECHEDEHTHSIASLSAFIGLSVHAFVDGLVLAASMMVDPNIGALALVGMCIHKFVVLFSLSSTFLLTDLDKKTVMKYLFGFACITPVAAIISFIVLNGISVDGMVGIPLAFSAGTFMYVALCDMIPEAFHRKTQDSRAFIMLLIGIAIAAAVFLLMGHGH